MPSVIPFDPSIVLGNIVDPQKLNQLHRIAEKQAPIDVAENNMNSLITLKRSIDSTIHELANMGVDTHKLSIQSEQIKEEIKKAAMEYAEAKLNGKKRNSADSG